MCKHRKINIERCFWATKRRLLAAEILGKIRLDDIITRSSSLLYYDLANVISSCSATRHGVVGTL